MIKVDRLLPSHILLPRGQVLLEPKPPVQRLNHSPTQRLDWPLGSRRPVSLISRKRLRLLPITTAFSISLSIPIQQCSRSSLKLLASCLRICEHLAVQMKSRISVVSEVYVARSSAYQLLLSAALLCSAKCSPASWEFCPINNRTGSTEWNCSRWLSSRIITIIIVSQSTCLLPPTISLFSLGLTITYPLITRTMLAMVHYKTVQ